MRKALLLIVILTNFIFASNKVALVIGNSDYKVSPLISNNPVEDAKAKGLYKKACNGGYETGCNYLKDLENQN